MTTKIDYKKELKPFYATTNKEPHILDVPPANYLMIDGRGDPNVAQSYADAVTTLYNLAYSIRGAVKSKQDIAFTVMPLQGLWWIPNMADFIGTPKADWLWTSMIMQPEIISTSLVEEQIEAVRSAKQPPSIDLVRFETYDEGTVVQRLYLGPYKDEGPYIKEMHEFAEAEGYQLHGKHHEIYLSDPRKTAPEKLKTIIRQPITKA